MAPLIVLAVATIVFRLLGKWRVSSLDSWPAAVRAGLAVMFLFTAMAHFTPMRHDLARMAPPWVPNPELVVLFTGVCEIAGAVGLLIRRPAGSPRSRSSSSSSPCFRRTRTPRRPAFCSGANRPRP